MSGHWRFQEGGWFSSDRLVWDEDMGIGGWLILVAIIIAILIFLIMVGIMLLPFLFILVGTQALIERRYYIGYLSVIAFVYFHIDLDQEWISSSLFYDEISDGEVSEGILGLNALKYFKIINYTSVGVGISYMLEALLIKKSDFFKENITIKQILVYVLPAFIMFSTSINIDLSNKDTVSTTQITVIVISIIFLVSYFLAFIGDDGFIFIKQNNTTPKAKLPSKNTPKSLTDGTSKLSKGKESIVFNNIITNLKPSKKIEGYTAIYRGNSMANIKSYLNENGFNEKINRIEINGCYNNSDYNFKIYRNSTSSFYLYIKELGNEVVSVKKNNETKREEDVISRESNKEQLKSIKTTIINNSTNIEGIYFIEEPHLVKSLLLISDISAFSGWGGIIEHIGVRNAKKTLASKASEVNGNVVLITDLTNPWGGVKLFGSIYKFKE